MNDRLRYRNPNLTGLLLKRQFASGSSRIGAPANASQAYRAIDSWAESDSLKRCSASYCQLNPPPRSTIAAAFSPDGQLVASTQLGTLLLGSPLHIVYSGSEQRTEHCFWTVECHNSTQ